MRFWKRKNTILQVWYIQNEYVSQVNWNGMFRLQQSKYH
jgi:hypothetical protein